jgi:hypothetical protein
MNSLTHIRSLAIGKANRLQRAARHFDDLRPAFAEWEGGEIYVCKKTGTYRYRFGERSKAVTAWDGLARETFATPADFAFAALVLAEHVEAAPEESTPKPQAPPSCRANVITLAAA